MSSSVQMTDISGREIRIGDTVVGIAESRSNTNKFTKTSLQHFLVEGFTEKRVLLKTMDTDAPVIKTNRQPEKLSVIIFNSTDNRLC